MRKPTARNWEQKFLDLYAINGNLTVSAAACQVNRSTVQKKIVRNPEFAQLVLEAREEAFDRLEAEAHRRAVNGVEKPVFYMGEVCGSIKEYSDSLLITLLKACRPGKFRDSATIEQTIHGNGPVLITEVIIERQAPLAIEE